ncbi:hypothetical protein CHS0354_000875, partial [Potamilus streckersoni]
MYSPADWEHSAAGWAHTILHTGQTITCRLDTFSPAGCTHIPLQAGHINPRSLQTGQ